MIENIKCPCCGSEDIQVRGPYPNDIPCHCFDCPCEWDESKRQPSNAWIPCSERVPECYKRVLVFTDAEIIEISCLDYDGFWLNKKFVDGENVYWQPLPSPPERKDLV